MMKFINWFKGSVEDDQGVASYRRIQNYIILGLVAFVVLFVTIKNTITMLYIYLVLVLIAAILLNTSVITTDNILRFFNKAPEKPPVEPKEEAEQTAELTGSLTIKKNNE